MRPHESHHCEISGEEIRSVRDHWAMPRSEFADIFGVQPGTVYAWECEGVCCRSHKFDYRLFGVLRLSRDVLGPDDKKAN
jgi:DNA-binding XRE family transcriptional regulator